MEDKEKQEPPERIWLEQSLPESWWPYLKPAEGRSEYIRADLAQPVDGQRIAEVVQWIDQQIEGIQRSSMVEASRGALNAFLKVREKMICLPGVEGERGREVFDAGFATPPSPVEAGEPTPILPFICCLCGVQQDADGICANCGKDGIIPTGRTLFCSCGAALDVPEYMKHRAMGHDSGINNHVRG